VGCRHKEVSGLVASLMERLRRGAEGLDGACSSAFSEGRNMSKSDRVWDGCFQVLAFWQNKSLLNRHSWPNLKIDADDFERPKVTHFLTFCRP
jgi:hypothetical protein